MNGARRRALAGVRGRLEAIRDELDAICEEEDDAHEKPPGSLKDGERGWAMRAAADALYGASASLDDAIEPIGEACG